MTHQAMTRQIMKQHRDVYSVNRDANSVLKTAVLNEGDEQNAMSSEEWSIVLESGHSKWIVGCCKITWIVAGLNQVRATAHALQSGQQFPLPP